MTGTPPRTLWVTNDFPPRSGGIEQFVANLLARLDPDTVRVVASHHPDAARYDATLPYPVVRAARRPLLPTPAVARRVRSEAAQHHADLIVFGASWPLAELAPHMGLPSVALTHGHEAGIVKVGGGPMIRSALRGVAGIGVISDYTSRALAPWVPHGTAVHRVAPGVDVDRFHPEVSGADVRRRYGIDAQTPLVLCLSRLVARKGQDVLVEVWPRVLAEVAGAHLLIAGGGPREQRLRQRVATLNMTGSITFAGDVPSSDLSAFHAAADLFAMPCRTRMFGLDVEGLGIVYLEAQATGTPVVAGASGGAPEAVIHGKTGLVVNGGDFDAVLWGVVDLLNDSERRRAMAAAGRRFVVERYAWDVVGRNFEAMLHDAVTG